MEFLNSRMGRYKKMEETFRWCPNEEYYIKLKKEKKIERDI